MQYKPCTTLVLVASLLLMAATLMPISTFGAEPVADVVAVEGAKTMFQVHDQNGRLVEVEIPSQSLQDIQMSNGRERGMLGTRAQAQRTVLVTVASVDAPKHLVTVLTQYGQTLVLSALANDLQIGEQLTLVMPW